MQASPPLQFPAGASPFQIGGNPLFKTAGNEPIAAPPINSASGMSPFSIIGATPTNSPLTVGDVINQLPAEVVRMGALPAEQPLSLPPALLENALRSGQAALPVFELYRVCPALFQVPISPQDPRLVALPAAKLPGLIAQAREGNGALPAPASAASPSPFSFAQPATPTPAPVGSPFQMAPLASNPAVQQPPPSPFSLGVSPSGSPFGMSQQPAAVAPAPGSPFSLGASPGASPFGMSQQPAAAAPAPSPGSPFSFGATPSGSPFGMSQQPEAAAPAPSPGSPFSFGATPSGSPFGMSQQPEATSLAPSPGSPFSLGASPGASPFGMSQQPAAAAPSTLSESPFSLGAGSSGSPFGMAQQPAAVEPPPIPGSPFSFGSGQGGSPFGMSQQPVAAPPATSPGSPFSPAPPENWASSAPAASQPQASISTLFTPPALQRASTPSDMAAAPAMPFGSPFPAAQPTTASPSKPLQPLIGAFQSFGASQAASLAQTAPPPNSTHPGTAKPFDPFASSSTGPLAAKASAESGFNSAQLLGQVPTTPQQPVSAFTPAPETKPATSLFATPTPALSPFQPTPSFAPALEEIPSFSTPAPPAPQPASRGLFSTQAATVPLFSEPVTPQARPEPKPVPAAPALQATPSAAPAKMAAVKHSFLGLSPLDTQTDQLLLRALLGTEEKLSAPRVVELLALQQGLSACVCLHGSHVLSHADSSKTDAVEFQRQAPDIARQLRGLAPLIGIEGAETFTLNAGGRLLTFCFPGDSIIGVLHDDEPSTGMRDKITLIARELARMLG